MFLNGEKIHAQNLQGKFEVLTLGDSITAGYGLPRSEAWPALLEKDLRAKFSNKQVKVWNAGVSGNTSSDLLARLDWALKQSPVWDAVVLCIGANDGMRQVPIKNFEQQMDKILQNLESLRAQGKIKKIILLGMQVPTSLNAKYRKEFESVYLKLAKKYKIKDFKEFFLESVAAKQDLNQEDGIHPNAKGHQILKDEVLKFF